jgi:crotonobetainyl-CoA:carnitine CoA-transferase CaiB-like acyl-CoA transferase
MMSGYVGVSYEAAGRFNPPMPSPCNEDPGNGLLGAAGILMGLLHRQRTGAGVYVENPQLNAAMFHVAHIVRRRRGEVVGAGRLDPMQYGFGPFERLYATEDGWICVVAADDVERAALLGLVRASGLADEEALGDCIAAWFAGRPTASALGELRRSGIQAVEPAGRDVGAFLADPEHRRTGRVVERPHPTKGHVREIGVLVRASGASVPSHRLAPALGADTDAILESVGYLDDEISALRSRGAIA